MKSKKGILIIILCVLVCIMAGGYAMTASDIIIRGKTSIDSTWNIGIVNIEEKNKIGQAISKEVPTYTAVTANFNVGLSKPGDSISYDITIKNAGTLNAKVSDINVVTSENEAIVYEVSGIKQDDKLLANSEAVLTIKVTYNKDAATIENNTKDITVIINYVQD